MMLIIKHTKVGLPKFKEKGDLNIYIRYFNNIYQTNKKTTDKNKLEFFSITFKK